MAVLLFGGACTIERNGAASVAEVDSMQVTAGRADSVRADQDSTAGYQYAIEYPPAVRTPPAAGDAMRAWAEARKRDFVEHAPDGAAEASMPLPSWELLIRFRTPMATEVFTSVLAEGYEYTGGAHGMPFYEAFNYDLSTGRRLTLEDLFPDSTALRLVSEYVREDLSTGLLEEMAPDTAQGAAEREARARLEQWIAEGTAPVRAHYETFYFVPAANGQAAGITFVLAPYQVAPYAAGTQEVFVPTVVFQDGLNPAYRDRFSERPPVESEGVEGRQPAP